jgi:hypothetical protein
MLTETAYFLDIALSRSISAITPTVPWNIPVTSQPSTVRLLILVSSRPSRSLLGEESSTITLYSLLNVKNPVWMISVRQLKKKKEDVSGKLGNSLVFHPTAVAAPSSSLAAAWRLFHFAGRDHIIDPQDHTRSFSR